MRYFGVFAFGWCLDGGGEGMGMGVGGLEKTALVGS